MNNEELKTLITAHTPDAEFEESQFLNVIVSSDKLHALAKHLRNEPNAEFDYLISLAGVDWNDHFMVVYHLQSRKHKYVFVLKAKIVEREAPTLDTVSDIWKTADLHEREVYDLFGIKFNNHPDLRRLFLDDTWGFPLRKDYKDDVTIVQL